LTSAQIARIDALGRCLILVRSHWAHRSLP
jgi:hypothetical protein